jgi:hypothetical protein
VVSDRQAEAALFSEVSSSTDREYPAPSQNSALCPLAKAPEKKVSHLSHLSPTSHFRVLALNVGVTGPSGAGTGRPRPWLRFLYSGSTAVVPLVEPRAQLRGSVDLPREEQVRMNHNSLLTSTGVAETPSRSAENGLAHEQLSMDRETLGATRGQQTTFSNVGKESAIERSCTYDETRSAVSHRTEKPPALSAAGLAARRANAQIATGPHTLAGKIRSSQNARKHWALLQTKRSTCCSPCRRSSGITRSP